MKKALLLVGLLYCALMASSQTIDSTQTVTITRKSIAYVDRMDRELNLSDVQKSRLNKVVSDIYQGKKSKNSKQNSEDSLAKIEAILTPEQLILFKELKADLEQQKAASYR